MRYDLSKETKRTAFATRASAAELRTQLAEIMTGLPPGKTFELALKKVEAMTVSFADELVGKLITERRVLGSSDTFFLISGATPEVLETIQVALERRNLFVVHRGLDGQLSLVAAPEHLQETFASALSLREFTAADLAGANVRFLTQAG